MSSKKIATIICLILLGFLMGLFVGRSSVLRNAGNSDTNKNVAYDKEDAGLKGDEEEKQAADNNQQDTTDNVNNSKDDTLKDNTSNDGNNSENNITDDEEESDEKDKYELPEF